MRNHTAIASPFLCPDISLHLITSAMPMWHASDGEAEAYGLVDPFWAFCWAGGQALARYVLDHPDEFAGKTVLDFGAGGGVEAIAAARCGANVIATDIDPMAVVALELNAKLNGVEIVASKDDVVGLHREEWDIVLIGDVTYSREMAARVQAWTEALAASGVRVLLADPRRGYLDTDRLCPVATYEAPADDDPDGSRLVPTTVFTVPPRSEGSA